VQFLLKKFDLLLFVILAKPKSTSTPIKWKEDIDLSADQPQIERKTFFSWFNDNSDPIDDFIADVIKHNLWPDPVPHYLAACMEDEDDDESLYVSLFSIATKNPYQFIFLIFYGLFFWFSREEGEDEEEENALNEELGEGKAAENEEEDDDQ